ncbi:MAG: GtrA family protein [Acutalibacteraceae bacterium]|nr:GtrA family protein [Acutalibacteraceae bacterium]
MNKEFGNWKGKLDKMNLIKKLFIKYREVIDYLFWGILTTVVSWCSFGLFSISFNAVIKNSVSAAIICANILSWLCATAFAFVTNKLWVFRSKSWNKKIVFTELSKFVSARMATGIFELIAVPLLVKIGLNQTILDVEGMFSKILVSIIVVILNYLLSKIFIFKK